MAFWIAACCAGVGLAGPDAAGVTDAVGAASLLPHPAATPHIAMRATAAIAVCNLLMRGLGFKGAIFNEFSPNLRSILVGSGIN